MSKILFVNGPNLNLLGRRQINIYGKQSLNEVIVNLKKYLPDLISIHPFQNNSEGEIINFLNSQFIESHQAGADDSKRILGIIINPGAYTHTSIAIRDALEVFLEDKVYIYEVHLSNLFKREEFRHTSYISPIVNGVICGLGAFGYEAALIKILQDNKEC